MKLCLALFALLTWLLLGISPALAANPDTQNYRRAFALIDSGHVLDAEVFAAHGHDQILNKVIHGLYLAQPGNDVSFNDSVDFIAQNPGWPNLKGILAIAETKIPNSWTHAEVIDWFTAHPPVSAVGVYRFADALNVSGRMDESSNLIRSHWIESDFTVEELIAYHASFQSVITSDDNWERLDRLLWKGDMINARHMYPFITPDIKALAEARIALATRSEQADRMLNNVPAKFKDEPGLVYEILRWRVRNNQDDTALAILRHPPDFLKNTEAWWEQRQIMTRRLIANRDFEGAYQLAVNHGHLEGKQLADAEFLCGWLALRFLNEPDEARQHFESMLSHTKTPISHARAAYWLGRTYEVLDEKDLAVQAYSTAAALNITFYGQLAATRIYEKPILAPSPDPEISEDVRSAFNSRDIIRAVERLTAINENDRAHTFFHAALDTAETSTDFVLLTQLAHHIDRPDLVIEAGKAGSQKNIMMTASNFPLLGHKPPSPPEAALTHALIRQESQFNPIIRSPAGAEGLMQLMPGTAAGVAKKLGVRFKSALLNDPEYNVRLGTSFVQKQVDDFDGSYVLALAGYNAGPHRVREWLAQIGDPRNPEIDVIDWIELIPIYETRNYVQRILEALQVYRARLSGGRAPLQIIKDLKR